MFEKVLIYSEYCVRIKKEKALPYSNGSPWFISCISKKQPNFWTSGGCFFDVFCLL